MMLVSNLSDKQRSSIYIDMDTTFTAYIRSGLLLKKSNHRFVDCYLPTEGNFETILKNVIRSMFKSSIVIFDSVNSFYNMYYKNLNIETGYGISNLNHLLSVFLMLLVKHGVCLQVPVLVTSLIRLRNGREWYQSAASKRILDRKSLVKLNVEVINDDIAVEILKHPNHAPQSIVFKGQTVKL
ncbi:MAG TPA: hypothetical protein VI033_04735 [Candidatus Nitrosopolaris sp.]